MTRSPSNSAATNRLVFLDYLRVFAFASVLVGHKFIDYLNIAAFAPDTHPLLALPARLMLPFVRDGGVGVVTFFLVSGYIITHVLKSETTAEFLIKRLFRIYPLYVAAVLAEFALKARTGSAPDVGTLLLQMSLMGDFFGTPYALKGVEWTLRVEILFYVMMAVFRQVNLIGSKEQYLPQVLALAALMCIAIAPFPTITTWSHGYLSIYGPFLLLGSACYLHQSRAVSNLYLTGFALMVLCINYVLLLKHNPENLGSHFGLLAFLVFAAAWTLRARMPHGRLLAWLSELTYSVYLFHNWVFDPIRNSWMALGFGRLLADACALGSLLLLCTAIVHLVEQPGIAMGRWWARRISAFGIRR